MREQKTLHQQATVNVDVFRFDSLLLRPLSISFLLLFLSWHATLAPALATPAPKYRSRATNHSSVSRSECVCVCAESRAE